MSKERSRKIIVDFLLFFMQLFIISVVAAPMWARSIGKISNSSFTFSALEEKSKITTFFGLIHFILHNSL